MRLAFITSLLPTDRPETGPELADACIVRALQQAGCEVRRFGFLRDGEAAAPRGAVVVARSSEDAPAPFLRRMGWFRDSARLGLPLDAARLVVADSGALRSALDRDGPFDGCVINGSAVAAAFPWLLDDFPALLVAHDVGYLSARAQSEGAGFLDGVIQRRDAGLIRRSERRAIEAARFVWCLADEDRVRFDIDIAAKSAVLPLVAAARGKAAAEAAADVGLIGRWRFGPELAGLRWFLDKVAPRLPGDIGVAVAGAPSGLRSADPRIILAGRAPDAAAFITSCRCMALTSRADTGIRPEAVEILQLGMPAVATRASVRGVGWLPANCLVADEAAPFAAALTKLVRDLRSERSTPADGRAFIEAQKRGLRNGIAVGLAALREARRR